MAPLNPDPDWAVDRRRATRERLASTLSPQTIDELATHLEDIYLAARADGDDDAAAAPEGRARRSRRPASCRSAASRAPMPARPTRAPPTTPPRRPDPGVSPWSTPFAWRCASSACIRRSRHRRPRARPRHRRRDRRLHHRRLRRPAAAAVPRARSPGEALGHQHREGPRARSVLAGHVHGLPGAAGVRGRGGVVAAGRQPARSRARSGAGQDHRDERQPVRGARRRHAARRRLPEGRPVLLADADRGDQRSALAHALRRRPVGRRPPAAAQRHALHGRRRDAGRIPLPRRRRRVAAAAVGSHAAQPQRPLHGRRRAAEGRRVDRAGARRRGHAGGPARPAVRGQQQGLGVRGGAAARRSARLLPAGALRAVRRGRPAVRHRLPERRLAAADARARPRARDRRAHRARRGAAADRHAAAGRELDPVGGRRRRRPAGRAGRPPGDRRGHAGGRPPPRRGRGQPARPRAGPRRSSSA